MTFSTTASAASVSTPIASSEAPAAPFRFERETWLAIQAAWKKAAHAKTATAAQHAVYTLMRGASITKAFSPITNPQKVLSNGNNPHFGRDQALWGAQNALVTAYTPWLDLLKDVPRSRNGRLFEGSHPILDAVRAEAKRQGF